MSEKSIEFGWDGNPIPDGETSDTEILIWSISEGPDGDEHWVRDYHVAQDKAGEMICDGMDGASQNDLLEGPLIIHVQLKRVQLSEYEAAMEREP
jgi:hypothetical protein